MSAAQLAAARAKSPGLFESSIQESSMTLVRSIFLALVFTFAAGTVAQAADPAPAAEAPAGGEKKEKKAKKSKKAEGGEEKKAEEKK
jgi:hypothetical protein